MAGNATRHNISNKMAKMKSLLVYILFMIVAPSQAMTTSDLPRVNISFGANSFLRTSEGVTTGLNVTIHQYEAELDADLLFSTTDSSIFRVVNVSSFPLAADDVYPKHLTVMIHGVALGIEDLEVKLKVSGSDEAPVVETLTVKVNLQPKAVMTFVKYFMLVCVVISFVNMGGTIDLKLIWEKLRRPWAVLIGVFCQFLIMPPLAFGLALLFKLDSASAIGLVLDGSCPGGYLSNLLSIMLDVDYVLSLTMTFCSNILAMGMMPLNLFIYTPPLTSGNKHLDTPFLQIGTQLVLMLIPISVGVFFRYKSPRIHRLCVKLLKPLSGVLIFLLLATSLPFQLFIFAAPTNTYIASFLLPLCGGLLGFTFARLACLPLPSMMTIALETGVQNALLATTIITFFYPHPEAEIASRAPYLILCMTMIEGIALMVGYNFFRTFVCRKRDDEIAIVEKEGDDEKKEKGVIEVSNVIEVMEMKSSKDDIEANDVKPDPYDLHKSCQTDMKDDMENNNCFSNIIYEQCIDE